MVLTHPKASRILRPRLLMEVSGQFHDPAAFPTLGGTQSRSERGGK